MIALPTNTKRRPSGKRPVHPPREGQQPQTKYQYGLLVLLFAFVDAFSPRKQGLFGLRRSPVREPGRVGPNRVRSRSRPPARLVLSHLFCLLLLLAVVVAVSLPLCLFFVSAPTPELVTNFEHNATETVTQNQALYLACWSLLVALCGLLAVLFFAALARVIRLLALFCFR